MKQKYFLITGTIIILATILISGCAQQQSENPKIGDIIQNPSSYQGKTVIIDCKYGGWIYGGDIPVCKRGPQVTMSDYCVYDETGCIYTSGVEILSFESETHKLDPTSEESIGTELTIKGTIRISDKNIPYIGK
ncbi:MAG: hypothetical protein U9Q92_02510 [archaeon]|nr:hypothetical protein [archaeon]